MQNKKLKQLDKELSKLSTIRDKKEKTFEKVLERYAKSIVKYDYEKEKLDILYNKIDWLLLEYQQEEDRINYRGEESVYI